MARTKFFPASIGAPRFGLARGLALGFALGLAGCVPSPLYVRPAHSTTGEIPRDGRGEPDWAAIRPVPPPPPRVAMPVPAGIAITPPRGVPPRP